MRFLKKVKEALTNIFRNKTSSFGTLVSISATLFILGIVLISILNINNFVINSKLKFYNIKISFNQDTTSKQIESIKNTLNENFDLKSITYESKEEAMENFKSRFGEDGEVFDGIRNPLSDSLIVELKSLSQIKEIEKSLEKNSFIESIEYFKEELELLENISGIVSLAGLVIIILLFIITLFVIANTIKIAIFSRMKEINIMKYIGATNWYIRVPFIIEGVLIGLIGSIISSGIILFLYFQLYNFSVISEYSILQENLIAPKYILRIILEVFLISGAGIGSLGSLISLRKYLEV